MNLTDAINEKVRGVMSAERTAVEAACYRLVTAIGVEAFRARADRKPIKGDPLDPVPPAYAVGTYPHQEIAHVGRGHELTIDGAVVWRGWWEPEGSLRATWRTRWLVEPETLRTT